jgi:hypothetical protein
VSHDEVGPEPPYHAIQVQQLSHPAVANLGKQTRDPRRLKFRVNGGEIVLLWEQRRHADFMATALMMNGQSFYKYFCSGQARCMNQLKNPHDLSLWITAFFAQRRDAAPVIADPK